MTSFTPCELGEIIECADRGTPRLYRIQQIMQPKQQLSREVLTLHGRVCDLRNDVNSSCLADLCRGVAADVLDWARRELSTEASQ